MRTYVMILTFTAIATANGTATADRNLGSMYTDIAGEACTKRTDDQKTGARTLDCPGVNGYHLQILEDDERSSVSIVTPDKRIFSLNYWDVVTHGFSTLGAKAEWRLANIRGRTTPIAIIVRVNALDQSNPENPKRVPLLAVAKIHRHGACVTQAVPANVPGANEKARRFADDKRLKCLSRQSDIQPPAKG